MAFALTPEREQQVDDLISRYPTRRAALIPVLWVCQRQNGWISPEVIDFVATRLEISAAAVKGVVTFYTMFHEHEVGENVVWVCRTLSCDLRGGKVVQDHLEKRFGCHSGGTSKNGKFSLFKAECLAACGQGPMIQINDRYFENLNLEKLDEILDAYENDGAESAEARFADTAIYNGHVAPPGVEAPPEVETPTKPASVPPPAATAEARKSSIPPAGGRPKLKGTMMGMPAVRPPSPSKPPPKPETAKESTPAPAPAPATDAPKSSAPPAKAGAPSPKFKGTMMGMPAVKPPSASPPAEGEAADGEDKKEGEE